MAGIDAVRAKRPQYVPTVLTKQEAIAVIQQCDGIYQSMMRQPSAFNPIDKSAA
jgi:hypothetical protein